jgi:hypothetical protein
MEPFVSWVKHFLATLPDLYELIEGLNFDFSAKNSKKFDYYNENMYTFIFSNAFILMGKTIQMMP